MQDELALKLHTAPDGVIWFADGDRVPISSGLGVTDFVKSLAQRERPFVRILGGARNAPLIVAVYPYCMRGGRLELASPAACRSHAERSDPEVALYLMRQWNPPPSLGGWHRAREVDYTSYALVAQFYRDREYNMHISELLSSHPAWPHLAFVEGVSREWAAWMLSFIIDPRWFIDRRNPDRVARLQAFMGLNMKTQRQVSAGVVKTPHAGRCRAVLQTWKAGGEPSRTDIERPGNFLWRIRRHVGGGVRGDLRASQKLLVYTHHTWLSAIYADTQHVGAQGDLFLPRMLFKTQSELQAYAAHTDAGTNPV